MCLHCERADDSMPGWHHEARAADANGVVRHVWWAKFRERAWYFAAGVIVRRHPAIVGGAIGWRLKVVAGPDAPGSRNECSGYSVSIDSAVRVMVGEEGLDGSSYMARWALQLSRAIAEKKKPMKTLPPEDFTSPF